LRHNRTKAPLTHITLALNESVLCSTGETQAHFIPGARIAETASRQELVGKNHLRG